MSKGTIFILTVAEDGVAELRFDLPGEKINKFSLEVLDELEQHLDRLTNERSVQVLKITSGKEDSFCAGADLKKFEQAFDDPALAKQIVRRGHQVFNKLAHMPFPTIAVINGICVGGGLEMALACTYRIVGDHPKTSLALPEVTLGIFPGWGGTQRLPRLIGLQEALAMILTGKAVTAVKAYKMHLADAVAASAFLPQKVDAFIQEILRADGKAKILARRRQRSLITRLTENNPLGRWVLYHSAKKSILERTKGHYPAPLIALDVIRATYPLPLDEGLKVEAKTFVSNIPHGFALAKTLIPLFFVQESAKKETWIDKSIQGWDVDAATVIGAGTMGAGIAWLLASHHIFTRLKDISWDFVGRGVATIKGLFDKGVKAKKITPCDRERQFDLISPTITYSGMRRSQIVIEAATEDLNLKRQIFKELEHHIADDAIIATNTSSLSLSSMSQELRRPERFIAMHFFNPVHKMPLVEVAANTRTAPDAIATAVKLCKDLGKTPIVVGDCPGFLVNRIFILSANEVALMLEEGYSRSSLDDAIVQFGMPMGPFELADEIGNDVIYKAATSMEEAYGPRMKPAKLLQRLYEDKLYGRKTGAGYFLYKKGRKPKPNPEANKLIKALQHRNGDLNNDAILPRFLYVMINEAARCLEDKIITRADYLDLALVLGTGFPPFRGGLLRYADSMGISHIVETLKRFEKQHGMRFKPCPLLGKMAAENRAFYHNSTLQSMI